jgi:DNA adenine methylase
MVNRSPLRYPGGKSRLTNFITSIIKDNCMVGGTYVEPFAGGSGVALNLLMEKTVDNIVINDKDRSIYAFWYAILNHQKEFITKIIDTDITIDEWNKQREIQQKKETSSLFDLGFSTFFLNRCNRSGIIKAGVIGGIKQSGKWKIDARFNKPALIDKIKNIYNKRKNIRICNFDAISLINTIIPKLNQENTLIYFDPPYYEKGQQLYMNFFEHDDHVCLANKIKEMSYKWIVSYDDVKPIKKMYDDYKDITYLLRYTAGSKRHGSEIIFISDNLKTNSNTPLAS